MNPKFHKLFDLTNKTALVTGGAGLLGSKFCFALAEYGANVVIVDNQITKANDLARDIRKTGKSCIAIDCDVTNPKDINHLVEEVSKEFRSIDILVNNAAGKSSNLDSFFSDFQNYSIETWNEIMSVNLNSMFLLSQAVITNMVKNKTFGSIIQTSSIYGVLGPDQRIYEGSFYLGHQINTPAVYSASKAGVIGLTKYLSTYFAKDGIRVNSISPGGVYSGQNDLFVKNYSNRIPLGRMAQPEEMVGAILFLASEASSYVTGQNLIIDGGLEAW